MIFLNGGKNPQYQFLPRKKRNNNEEPCDRSILNIYIFFRPKNKLSIQWFSIGSCTLKF